jgi:hypothetical protein
VKHDEQDLMDMVLARGNRLSLAGLLLPAGNSSRADTR